MLHAPASCCIQVVFAPRFYAEVHCTDQPLDTPSQSHDPLISNHLRQSLCDPLSDCVVPVALALFAPKNMPTDALLLHYAPTWSQ
jgi:hypothetical protein